MRSISPVFMKTLYQNKRDKIKPKRWICGWYSVVIFSYIGTLLYDRFTIADISVASNRLTWEISMHQLNRKERTLAWLKRIKNYSILEWNEWKWNRSLWDDIWLRIKKTCIGGKQSKVMKPGWCRWHQLHSWFCLEIIQFNECNLQWKSSILWSHAITRASNFVFENTRIPLQFFLSLLLLPSIRSFILFPLNI